MNKYIGDRIRKKREERGLSLRELGERIDYNYNSLSKVERGTYNASPELLKKLADFFGVKVSYFYGEEQPMPKELEDIGADALIIAKEIRDVTFTQDELDEIIRYIRFKKFDKK